MAQAIFINGAAQSPAAAFVESVTDPVPVEFFRMVLADDPTFNLFIVDGAGDYAAESGAGGYSVEMLVGRLNAAAVAAQTSWSGITNGWTASLQLNTTELQALFGGQDEIEAYAQITITDPDAKPRTYAQQKIRLENRVLPAGGSGPTPIDQYLTSVETFDKFVQNRSAITGLVGGGSLNLDGIATVGTTAGWIVAVVLSGVLNFYQKRVGTDATSSPSIIRPVDYESGANEQVWYRLPISGDLEVMRGAGDPTVLGKVGTFDGQLYVDTTTNGKYNWNAPTSEWI